MKVGATGYGTRISSIRLISGFVLISALMLLSLVTLVAVAFLSLATVQVRNSWGDRFNEEARANARLALMIAIGELQRDVGLDQRVTSSSALGSPSGGRQKHWTAVYRTTRRSGAPFLTRDDLNGGLRDSRAEESGWHKPLNYLVSGNEGSRRTKSTIPFGPGAVGRNNGVLVVGKGSTNGDPEDQVFVPKVGVYKDQELKGGYGFWVGDLGVKANITVPNPHDSDRAPEKFLPLLGGFGPEAAGVESKAGTRIRFDEPTKTRIASNLTVDLAHSKGEEWRRSGFHDVTIHSQGVLANVRDGGLQRNLTVFLNRNTDLEPLRYDGRILSPGLSARSDTFVIRGYGESVANGKVKARAWCEAVVQRVPEPVRPDEAGLNPKEGGGLPDFGRRFRVKSFRWLNRNEV